jgi:hypothetical protein
MQRRTSRRLGENDVWLVATVDSLNADVVGRMAPQPNDSVGAIRVFASGPNSCLDEAIMSEDFRAVFLRDVVRTFRNYKALAEAAIGQVNDAELHAQLDPDSNSIAIIVKHLAGNLRSRFRDFLTSDGEKPDRDRDAEFEMPDRPSRDEILAGWNGAWATAMGSIEALTPEDLDRTVRIRGEAFAVVEALNRLSTHTAYHVGQIVFIAKHLAGAKWRSLSIPKGKSANLAGDFKTRGIVRTP